MTQLSLTIDQTCEATGIGKTKLYEAISSGRLKAKKFGKRTIILKSDLEDFLNALETYENTKQQAN